MAMQISDAESIVMEVLWQRSPRSADEVIADLSREQDWQEPTIKTLLNRLLKKGAIHAEKDGRRYSYSAVLKRDEWVNSQSRSLLDRLFGGQVAPLVAHFSEKGKLSKKDIAELKRLVEGLDNEH
jgi:predicted transcriptional regulator